MGGKVLFITFYFPPSGSTGGLRALKFVKYLPSFGWTPIVITVTPEYYNHKDDFQLSEIPKNVKVIRTGLSKKIIMSDFGFRWIVPLIKIGSRIIPKEKPELIFFTGSPFFHFIVGPYFFFKYRIPYIIDFRDPWCINSWFKRRLNKSLKYRFNDFFSQSVEKVSIKNSAAVTSVSQVITNNYKKVYSQDREKFHTITNGFDPEDFCWSSSSVLEHSQELIICHVGTIDHFKNLTNFAKAMKNLIRDYKKTTLRIYFMQVGDVRDDGLDVFKKLGIGDFVINIGYKSHNEALKFLMQSDILLLHNEIDKACPTSKIFEYLYSCKPILDISLQGGIDREILSKFPWKSCIKNEVDDIYIGLKRLIDLTQQLKKEDILRKERKIKYIYKKYSRIFLTKELAELLDSVSKGSKK